MVLYGRAGGDDVYAMTALTAFERNMGPLRLRCGQCQRPAWASTPSGLLCQEHTIAEVEDAVAEGRCDWVPRILGYRGRRTP